MGGWEEGLAAGGWVSERRVWDLTGGHDFVVSCSNVEIMSSVPGQVRSKVNSQASL